MVEIWGKNYRSFKPVGICLLKVNNRNTRRRSEICSKLAIKTPDIFTPCSSAPIVKFWACNSRLGSNSSIEIITYFPATTAINERSFLRRKNQRLTYNQPQVSRD